MFSKFKKSLVSVIRNVAVRYFSGRAAPYWIILAIDGLLVIASSLLAFALEAGLPKTLADFYRIVLAMACYMLFYLVGFRVMRTYSGVIRYSSFSDLYRISVANLIAVAAIFLVRHLTPIDQWLYPIPANVLFITFLLSILFMWSLRIAVKYLYEVLYVSNTAQKVFIYGVKEGGTALAASIRSQKSRYLVSGFVSDDPNDCQHLLMGVRIYLNNANLTRVMRRKGAGILMVSPLKNEDLRNNKGMIDALFDAGIKILFHAEQEWDVKQGLHINQFKEVDIEDLLPRSPIGVDLEKIGQILSGQCILITGAAGSIGSEIVRQVASFHPSQLVLIDQAETPLHDIRRMMASKYPDLPALTLTASICRQSHMEKVFETYRPAYVFHAAAYKHVPMMEDNPGEAVLNNVVGTRVLADLSVKYGVKKFVMVSTDKAVNPTNVMGCSKRICEMYCQSLNQAIAEGKVAGVTQFVTTRFGNVLGSNGSVIPIFKEQIRHGGPVTVTHPDIIRYFMLIPEACRLVLQAGTMGQGGEIFVFDMGQPVKIADLAKRLIQLSGVPDVKIEYTGLRDGEKLYEELLNDEETTKPSSHPKIKLAVVRELGYEEVCRQIDELTRVTGETFDDMEIVREMKRMVPEFKSKNSIYEQLDTCAE